MRIKEMVLLSTVLIFMAGCAVSASRMNDLNVGMTKTQVIDIMGTPDYTSARKGVEVLCYKLSADGVFKDSFFVIVKQGIVERYGRQGDYGVYY